MRVMQGIATDGDVPSTESDRNPLSSFDILYTKMFEAKISAQTLKISAQVRSTSDGSGHDSYSGGHHPEKMR